MKQARYNKLTKVRIPTSSLLSLVFSPYDGLRREGPYGTFNLDIVALPKMTISVSFTINYSTVTYYP